MTTPTKLTLGDHEYQVAPQRYGYLRAQLGKKFGKLIQDGELAVDIETTDIPALLGDQLYDVLKLLIPDLMPRYEFEGFGSEDAWKQGIDAYVKTQDHGPTPPEIREALRVTMRLNELDLLGNLKGLLGEDFLGFLLRKTIMDNMEQVSLSTPASSPKSSPADTTSAPTNSGTPVLTPAA